MSGTSGSSGQGYRTHAIPTPEFRVRRFRLEVVSGPDRGSAESSDAEDFSVGTSLANRLVLTDPTVSRHHFVIAVTPKGFLLRDLKSTNGTRLGGHRVEAGYLEHGVTISAGATVLRFEELGSEIKEFITMEERFGRLIGTSKEMRRIFSMLPKLAAADTTVLIQGETGTGKNLIAETIHESGPRAKRPFVVVDCSAIPPGLLESELFGHEPGAIPGVEGARAGAFENAATGTILLDEIGEIPLKVQSMLLRVLEEHVVKRLGGTKAVRVDVRVIATTHRDLRQEVNKQTFRADLFYRLNVLRLVIPPLRERPEDLALLIAHFYAQLAGRETDPPRELSDSLAAQDWPGNVRELRSAVERAVLMGEPGLEARIPSTSRAQPADFEEGRSFRASKERAVARWERAWVTELMRRNGGNLSQAARMARMDRNHLREIVRRYQTPIGDE